jgi:hypothetical protein
MFPFYIKNYGLSSRSLQSGYSICKRKYMGLLRSSLYVCDVQNFRTRVPIYLIKASKVKEVYSKLVFFTGFLTLKSLPLSAALMRTRSKHTDLTNRIFQFIDAIYVRLMVE